MKLNRKLATAVFALTATLASIGAATTSASAATADDADEITTDRATGTTTIKKCNTDEYTKYVMKGDSRKIRVCAWASACSVQQIARNGSLICSYLSSWNGFVQPESDIDFLDGNVKTEFYSWDNRYGTTSTGSGCLVGGSTRTLGETWGGNYRYDELFDDHAKPRVRVTFAAQLVKDAKPLVSIVTLTGSDWTF